MSEERPGRRILPIICLCYQCKTVEQTLNLYGVNLCLPCCIKALKTLQDAVFKVIDRRYTK